jgi:hypothetical protein
MVTSTHQIGSQTGTGLSPRSAWPQQGLTWWTVKQTAYVSCVFSWKLADARDQCVALRSRGYQVLAGGPAVILNPDYLADVADTAVDGQRSAVKALVMHHAEATMTTRGCVRKCPFCAVPKTEGAFRELTDWEPRRLVCDNNLLASSKKHFDLVIDRLKEMQQRQPPSLIRGGVGGGVDFNQGLDARLLTKYHAERLAELDLHAVRLAFDSSKLETVFTRAYDLLRQAGISKKKMRAYVLIGYHDTPDDALYRLQTVRRLGLLPFPMRYEPLDARERGKFVGPGWSDAELRRFVKYWTNMPLFGSIPFKEFSLESCTKTSVGSSQKSVVSTAKPSQAKPLTTGY